MNQRFTMKMKHFSNFYSGRIKPRTWIRETAIYGFLALVSWFAFQVLLEGGYINTFVYWLLILLLVIMAGVLLSGAAVRRLHDKGESGHYAFYLLVPLLNFVAFKDLFVAGQDIPNRYGQVPLNDRFSQKPNLNNVIDILVAFIIGCAAFSVLVVIFALLFGPGSLLPIVSLITFAVTLVCWKWLKREE